MKLFKRVLLLLAIIIMLLPIGAKAISNPVHMYLFYGDGCSHCAALEVALKDVKVKYPNLVIHKYEVWGSSKNRGYMSEAASLLNVRESGVPFAIIGTRSFVGYSDTMTKGEIEYVIKVYSKVTSYKDPVGKMLNLTNNTGTATYEDLTTSKTKDYIINFPVVGPIKTKTLSLPLISILIGALDGFNPCAMWVLLFLISILIGMKNKKRMWILGVSFLLTSALIYLIFMLAWLNLAIFIGAIVWVKLLIASVALIGGLLNLRTFIKTKDNGCEIVDEKKRKKIFGQIKKFTTQKSFPLALIGIIALAVSVNFIELTCSAGLPVIFTNILAINQLSSLEYAFYIFLYILFFVADDLIVFFIAMTSLKLTGISTKYGKYSHLIGGILMVIIGLLMFFKPEWLMFNF